MSYTVLARKYRPQRFSDVIGQPHVTRTLQNAIEQNRIAHGYIFSGHRGIGKTTVARILAMALNCRSKDHPVAEPCGVCESCTEIRAGNAVDVIEIDAATNRGIDEIRELRDAARYRPARDRYKIYILDEAHQITDAAFNALLKTLEEPPGHVIFMMATTAPEDIPQTIRSRCQHFSFHAVRFDDVVAQLRDIAGKEKIAVDENALAMLAEAGDGSMRDALSIMDQAIACCGEALSADVVRGLVGTVGAEIIEELMIAVEAERAEDVLRIADRLITEGHNPTHFARQLARFLRNALVAKVAGKDSPLLQISADERERAARVAEMFGEEDLTRFLNIILRTHNDLGYRSEQRFLLELGLLKLVHARRLLPLEELLSEAGGAAVPTRANTGDAPAKNSGTVAAAPAAVRDAGQPAGNPFASRPSPFEADRARKSRSDVERTTGRDVEMSAPVESVGRSPSPQVTGTAALAEEPAARGKLDVAADVDALRERALNELENSGERMLAAMLEAGQWSVDGGQLLIKVTSAAMVDAALNAKARRVLETAAGEAAGRAVKVKIEGGGVAQTAAPRAANNAGGKDGTAHRRAADDPVVRRVQEKFGAEIRTVIDHRKR
jgi:DNA polymerase-3 subunit gamma/tau